MIKIVQVKEVGNFCQCVYKVDIVNSIINQYCEYIDNGEKLGSFILAKVKDAFFLHAVVIHADKRNQGHGTRMMQEIIEMTENGKIYLHVQTSNFVAIKLYENLGFEFGEELDQSVKMMVRSVRDEVPA